jgi:hypothetical protein
MSDDEENRQSHTTVDNNEEEASVSGSISSVRKKPNTFGKKNGKHRSENTIQELAGHLFTFGNQGQQSNYLKTKRAVANLERKYSGPSRKGKSQNSRSQKSHHQRQHKPS